MIKVDNLVYTYPGSTQPAVKGIGFEISEGEIFGFLGPSGAGKSTTQKILIGLLKGYHGSIQIMGRDLSIWGSDYYEHIGVSFELPNHYLKLTGTENLNYFRSLYTVPTKEPAELLKMVGLDDAADMPVQQYSKGMKMRLNFARSLLNQPKLLFLDEPTSGLDPVNARNVKDIVLKLRDQGTTVFVTTHDMVVADELCDRVAFMVNGSINLTDAPDALKKQYGRRNITVEYQNGNGASSYSEFPLDNLASNNEFLEILRQYRVETIHTQETTLENIFIQVTGQELA